MEAIVYERLLLNGWIFTVCDWNDYRANPSNVDALAVKAMALTINAGHFNADGCKRFDHLLLGIGA
jgi:hypothetical protein